MVLIKNIALSYTSSSNPFEEVWCKQCTGICSGIESVSLLVEVVKAGINPDDLTGFGMQVKIILVDNINTYYYSQSCFGSKIWASKLIVLIL